MTAIQPQPLWPDDPRGARLRPLHRGEEPHTGQRVYVASDETLATYRWHGWMRCGRDRFGLVLCDHCANLYVVGEEGIRVEA